MIALILKIVKIEVSERRWQIWRYYYRRYLMMHRLRHLEIWILRVIEFCQMNIFNQYTHINLFLNHSLLLMVRILTTMQAGFQSIFGVWICKKYLTLIWALLANWLQNLLKYIWNKRWSIEKERMCSHISQAFFGISLTQSKDYLMKKHTPIKSHTIMLLTQKMLNEF